MYTITVEFEQTTVTETLAFSSLDLATDHLHLMEYRQNQKAIAMSVRRIGPNSSLRDSVRHFMSE